MFCLTADKVCLSVEQRETVTSGSVNVYEVQFKFSADWEGLDRTAVFAAGEEQVSVVLGSSNTCTIPWEVLQSPRRELRAGVCGTKGGEVVLPTVWASLGTIREGCSPGENAQPPTPDVYGQILAAAEEAERIAQSVRDDADAGKFDGKQGPKGPPGDGVPPISEEDENKILGVQGGKAAWMPGGSGTGNVFSPDITAIRVMDRAEYDALPVKDPQTLYFIRG